MLSTQLARRAAAGWPRATRARALPAREEAATAEHLASGRTTHQDASGSSTFAVAALSVARTHSPRVMDFASAALVQASHSARVVPNGRGGVSLARYRSAARMELTVF